DDGRPIPTRSVLEAVILARDPGDITTIEDEGIGGGSASGMAADQGGAESRLRVRSDSGRGGHMSRKALWALPVIASCIAMFPVSAQERGRGRGATVTLPDGAGKEIVQAQCASCHALSLITNSGYSRDEWANLFTAPVALPP